MTQISPFSIAPPAANYAHAVLTEGATRWLHTSGVVPIAPDGSVPTETSAQARVIWQNISAMLSDAAMTPAHIVSVVTYVVDGVDLGEVMAARDSLLGDHRAASTLVTVQGLARPEWRMEIAIVAAAFVTAAGDPYDPATEGAEMSFDGRMSYADYLHLDEVLGAQHPISAAHDELLFIVQHQTSELWMRLAVHELLHARAAIADDRLQPAFKMLTRVVRIFEQLTGAWDVLRTMTPSEYTEFRDDLGQSSGFQSFQYRRIEFVLGNRNPAMLRPHEHVPEVHRTLADELAVPSLYDEALRYLARSGLEVPDAVLGRDLGRPHRADAAVVETWRRVYAEPERWWSQYELAEKLVDLEDHLRRWRFNHVTTVERVIGFKPGTGGTGGVSYLKRMLEIELFPDLWRVRTVL